MKPNYRIKTTTNIMVLLGGVLLFALSMSAFAMTDMNGNAKNLQSMIGKGKWTVAKVWASDCPACHKSISYMKQFQQRFPEIDVFGVSVDGKDGRQDANRFIKQFDLTFPNLLSDAMEVDDYLYARVGDTLVGTPTVILFNPKGKIAAVQPGAVTPDDLINFIRAQ